MPSPDELASTPHRLFGYMDGAEACSAARWADDAKREIEAAHAIGSLPVLVGGTGLYIRTLLDGIAPMPQINAEIRDAVRMLPTLAAWEALQNEDNQAAVKLSPNDGNRIKRALEVIRSTDKSILYWRQQKTGGIGGDIAITPLLLLPPRDWVYARCDTRFATMLRCGAVPEVLNLLKRNVPADAPVLRSIGVREITALLAEEISMDQTIRLGQIATRQYAKRQYTWFRNQSPLGWLRWEKDLNDSNIDKIVTLFQ